MKKITYKYIVLLFLLVNGMIVTAQDGEYAVRIVENSIDFVNAKYYIDIEVKAKNAATTFRIADASYVITFDSTTLSNPFVESELLLTGFVSTAAPADVTTSFFNPHTVMGSVDSVLVYNVYLAGGDGYPLTDTDWTAVGRVGFDLLDYNGIPNLRWSTHLDFPPTIILEKDFSGSLSQATGDYTDLIFFSTTAGIAPFPDSTATLVNTAVSIAVLANDIAVNSDIVSSTLVLTTAPTNGAAVVVGGSEIVYTPSLGFEGTDSFAYNICNDAIPADCANTVVEVVVATLNQYDVRLLSYAIDCDDMKYYADIEIKAPSNAFIFRPADQAYKFTFPSNLVNPVFEESISFLGPNYAPHGISVSQDTITYTVDFLGGEPSYVPSGYQKVGRISFDMLDMSACYELEWSETNVQEWVNSQFFSPIENSKTSTEFCPTTQNIFLFLEGALDTNTGLMSTALNEKGLLPGQIPTVPSAVPTPAGQPYNMFPWFYTGTESVTNYPSTVVDWVLVGFIEDVDDFMTPNSNVPQNFQAGLLHNDGRIEFLPSASFPTSPKFIYVAHRTHMPVATIGLMDFNCNYSSFDFRIQDSWRTPQSFGQKNIAGNWAAYAGNYNRVFDIMMTDINGQDNISWEENNGIFSQYLHQDGNLDGVINVLDKLLFFRNNGISSRLINGN